MSRRAAVCIAIALAACGGSSTHAPTIAPPPHPAPPPAILPLIDMTYVAADPGAKVIVVVVHADGRVDRPQKQGARIVDGRLVCADGTELLRVDEGGDVTFHEKIVAHLGGDGAFVVDPKFGNWSVTVRDDGDVQLTTRIEGTVSSHELRWEGFRPEARRTASLFSGLFTPAFGGVWCGEPAATNPM